MMKNTLFWYLLTFFNIGINNLILNLVSLLQNDLYLTKNFGLYFQLVFTFNWYQDLQYIYFNWYQKHTMFHFLFGFKNLQDIVNWYLLVS